MDHLLSRLKELETNLVELERFTALSFDEVQRDRRLTWALRYGLLESIQIVIYVACAVVSHRNLGYPKSYADCLRVLEQHDYLDTDLAERLTRAVGMRNVLIHEYLDVDDELVWAALDDLSDLRAFATQIHRLAG